MSQPLLGGSFHVNVTVFAVVTARSDTTAPGDDGGVTQLAIALNGPTPALLRACKYKTIIYLSPKVSLHQNGGCKSNLHNKACFPS